MEIQSDLSYASIGICFTWQNHRRLFRSRIYLQCQQGQELKWMTLPQTRMGIQALATPVTPETLQSAIPTGTALASRTPSAKKPLLSFCVQQKEQVWVTVKDSYVYEMFFQPHWWGEAGNSIFSHTPGRINRALCKATHPHAVNEAHITQGDGKISSEGPSSWLHGTVDRLHGKSSMETPQNHYQGNFLSCRLTIKPQHKSWKKGTSLTGAVEEDIAE